MKKPLLSHKKNNTPPIFLIFFILTVCLIFGKLSFCAFFIKSPSMEPAYPINSLVLVHRGGFGNIRQGDTIAFYADAVGGRLAFHRVIRVCEEGVYTKGDNSALADNQLITPDSYYGTEVFCIRFFARYTQLLAGTGGTLFFFVFPLAIIVLVVILAYKC